MILTQSDRDFEIFKEGYRRGRINDKLGIQYDDRELRKLFESTSGKITGVIKVQIERENFDLTNECIVTSPHFALKAHLTSPTLEAFVYQVSDGASHWGIFSLLHNKQLMVTGYHTDYSHILDPVEYAITHCKEIMEKPVEQG